MNTEPGEVREGWDGVLARYARRLARMCLLRAKCHEDHPMVRTERNLMDMARSKLQESMLRRLSVEAFKSMRPDIEFLVRQEAKDSVGRWDVLPEVAVQVLADIDREPLDSLFLLNC